MSERAEEDSTSEYRREQQRGLIGRFLRATIQRVVRAEEGDSEEAAELLSRIDALEEESREGGILPTTASGDGADGTPVGDTDEQNLLQTLQEMPLVRMAKTLAPLIALIFVKLIYELMPYVVSLILVVGSFEYIDKAFRTHISMSKSMMPSPR